MAATKNDVDMVNGPLWGKMLSFSLFYMMTALLQNLYSAADVIVVGRFAGQDALAGVGTCTALVNLFLNFFLGLSVGATIVLGQAIGAKNKDGIEKVVHTSVAIAIYSGVIVSVCCWLFTKQLLRMIDVPESVMPEAADYLRVIAIGYVPSLLYSFGAAILRAKGDTKRAMYIVAASGVINVLLNLFFVCVLKMTASGVALATVISQMFTAVVMVSLLCHKTDETRISLQKIRMDKEALCKILTFGVPSGIQGSVNSIANVLVQSAVNGFGATAVAGSSIITNITSFYMVMINSVYQAAMVYTSQNYGARKFDRIKKIILVCMTYAMGLWAIDLLVTFSCGKVLIGLYTKDLSVAEWAWRKFQILGTFYGLLGLGNVMSGVLRGMGASIFNMITSLVGICGIRILWVMTAFPKLGSYESLWACYPLSWVGILILHTIMFLVLFKRESRS